MRLTSQFGDQVERTFGHPVARVWSVVADVTRIGEWSPECYQVTWQDGSTGPAAGAVFVGRNRMGPLRWRTTCTIVGWEPQRLLCYDARHVSGAVTRWTFTLVERAGGGVVVTQSYRTMGSPRFVMLLDRLAGRPSRLRQGMAATLAGMAASLDHATA